MTKNLEKFGSCRWCIEKKEANFKVETRFYTVILCQEHFKLARKVGIVEF